MTRHKLKAYQDGYALAMAKYGLKRGIVGSEARHTTTAQYYRDLLNQTEDIQENIGLLLAEKEDVYITRNGKVVAKLTNPYQNRVDMAKSLFGILPADITLEHAREERLNKI